MLIRDIRETHRRGPWYLLEALTGKGKGEMTEREQERRGKHILPFFSSLEKKKGGKGETRKKKKQNRAVW